MIVVDASVLVNAIADDAADGGLARAALRAGGEVAAPDLVDVETVAVFRRRWLAGALSARRFSAAVEDLEALTMTRYPALPLIRRAYELRANVSAYDATTSRSPRRSGATCSPPTAGWQARPASAAPCECWDDGCRPGRCAAWDSNPARRIKSPVLYPMS